MTQNSKFLVFMSPLSFQVQNKPSGISKKIELSKKCKKVEFLNEYQVKRINGNDDRQHHSCEQWFA